MAARKKSTRKPAKATGARSQKMTSARSTRSRPGGGSSSAGKRKRAAKPKTSARKKSVSRSSTRPAAKTLAKVAPKKKRKVVGAAASRVSKPTEKSIVKSVKQKTAAPKAPLKDKKASRPALEAVQVKSGHKQAEAKVHPKAEAGGRPAGSGASTPAALISTAKPAKTGNAVAGPAASASPQPQGSRDQKVTLQEGAPIPAKAVKPMGQRQGFKVSEFVVYPAHGVGQIVGIEEQEVAGFKLELFVISFSKDKMTLRVPTSKVTAVRMRKISDPEAARRSLEILTGRARIKRTMWSRRAQEYETKINSGDINAIAEVVRDLYRSEAQPEQSYSERQLYEAALDRMVREIAAVQKSNEIDALKAVEAQLQKSHGRTKALAANAPNEVKDAEIEEAA
jgi:CarD family transcriptional regulator